MKRPAVYILTNKRNGTLYTGVTGNIAQRIFQHKNNKVEFTRKYNCKILVYVEFFEDMITAITREKQIKAGSRPKKLELIESVNPYWNDLCVQLRGL